MHKNRSQETSGNSGFGKSETSKAFSILLHARIVGLYIEFWGRISKGKENLVELSRRHSLTSQQRQYKISSETNFQYIALWVQGRKPN